MCAEEENRQIYNDKDWAVKWQRLICDGPWWFN